MQTFSMNVTKNQKCINTISTDKSSEFFILFGFLGFAAHTKHEVISGGGGRSKV